RVEPVQLAPARVRPRGQDLHPNRRQAEDLAESEDQARGRLLRERAIFGGQRGGQVLDERMEILRPWQPDLDDLVALAVDRLLRTRESCVVGKRHQRPVKRGLRFSRNARAPSTRSSVVRSSVARSFSSRIPSLSGSSRPLTTASLADKAAVALRYATEAVVKGMERPVSDEIRHENDVATRRRTTAARVEGARAVHVKRNTGVT